MTSTTAPAAGLTPEEVAHLVSIRWTADDDGGYWLIEAQGVLTDDEAASITIRTGVNVTLGQHVSIIDAEGTRIGYTASATYHERRLGPDYTVLTITLR